MLIKVRAMWDDEAAVWVAESDDVAGLVAEAATLEALSDKLMILIPELLDAKGCPGSEEEVPFELLASKHAIAHRHL